MNEEYITITKSDFDELLKNATGIRDIYSTPYGNKVSISSIVSEIYLLNDRSRVILEKYAENIPAVIE